MEQKKRLTLFFHHDHVPGCIGNSLGFRACEWLLDGCFSPEDAPVYKDLFQDAFVVVFGDG